MSVFAYIGSKKDAAPAMPFRARTGKIHLARASLRSPGGSIWTACGYPFALEAGRFDTTLKLTCRRCMRSAR